MSTIEASPSAKRRVLVYGGRGALGSVCVSRFKSLGYWVCSVDLAVNPDADANVSVSPSAATLADQQGSVFAGVAEALQAGGVEKLDGIVCVAGGWAGGNAASGSEFAASCDLVLRQSVWTSVVAAALAAKWLADGGLLLLTGARPALEATPGMIGYGMAKAAVHHMVRSLSAPNSGLPADARVLAILPVTLDTPANRRAMGEDSIGEWTPLEFVADLIAGWLAVAGGDGAPQSGSLLALITRDFKTDVVPE